MRLQGGLPARYKRSLPSPAPRTAQPGSGVPPPSTPTPPAAVCYCYCCCCLSADGKLLLSLASVYGIILPARERFSTRQERLLHLLPVQIARGFTACDEDIIFGDLISFGY